MNDSTPIQTAELLRHQRWVQGLARALVLDPAGADDVVQETWRRILERPPRAVPHPRAWLAAILRQTAANRARGEARRRRREEAVARPEAGHGPDEVAARAALQRDLVDAILGLPGPQRDALLARYYDELPPREIARLHGVPLATVKSRLKRGLEELRRRLDREYGDRRTWSLALLRFARPPAALSGAGLLLPAAMVAALAAGGAWLALRAHSGDGPSGTPATASQTEGDPAWKSTLRTPGSVAGESGTETLPVSPARSAVDGPAVQVLDAAGAPVSGARVRYAGIENGALGEATTDESGHVVLPAQGDFFLAVEPVVGTGLAELSTLGPEGSTLRLPPQGSLEVAFVDGAGRPVSGVEARLMSPDAGLISGFAVHFEAVGDRLLRDHWSELLTASLSGDPLFPPGLERRLWESARDVPEPSPTALTRGLFLAWPRLEPRRTSGPDGRMRWDGLPPASTWEVQMISDHHLPEPDEVRGVERLPDGSVTTDFAAVPPLNTSLPFEVRAGEATSARLELLGPASVHGVLEPGEHGWEDVPYVELIHVSEPDGLHRRTVERRIDATPSGAFSFHVVRPGEKILRSRWTDSLGRLRVVHAAFEVPPDAAVDLGSLTPLEGRELELRIRLRSPYGEELEPELVERGPSAPSSNLGLLVYLADGSGRWVDGYGDLEPWIGDSLHLTGIPEGDEVEVHLSLVDFVTHDGYRLVEQSLTKRIPFPDDGVIELTFVLHEIVDVTLRLEPADADLGPGARVRFVGPVTADVKLRVGEAVPTQVVAGRYRVFTRSSPQSPVPGRYFDGEMQVQAGDEVVLPLSPAAGLRGRVPEPGAIVWLALGDELPGPQESFGSESWTRADADGVFEIGGLPPSRSFVVRFAREYFLVTTGPAGSVREVVLE